MLLHAIHEAVVDLKQHYEHVDSNQHLYYMHENKLRQVENLLGKEKVTHWWTGQIDQFSLGWKWQMNCDCDQGWSQFTTHRQMSGFTNLAFN